MRTLGQTLTLWDAGLLTDRDVVDWAEREIRRQARPDFALIQLAFDGPRACVASSCGEPPFLVRPMPFDDQFAWRAVALDLQDTPALTAFAHWLRQAWIGAEDVAPAFFDLAAQVDHWIDDCGQLPAALALLRTELPALLPRCQELASAYGTG
jgi:hypothetical protein